MHLQDPYILLSGALLLVGIGAAKLAGRIGLPSLLLFLALGMLVGQDGTSWLPLTSFQTARSVGVGALILILFEGGLTAGFNEIKPVLRPAIGLATIGTAITALITGLAAMPLFHFTLLQSLLVGATLSSTDGAAVFALLRTSGLRRRLARTLEGEAGLNDPVAVLLVTGLIDWIQQPSFGPLDLVVQLFLHLGVGALIGAAIGWLAIKGLQHTHLPTSGLYPVASVGIALVSYGLASVLDGSGFLAAYLAGLALGSARIPARQTITSFHEGVAWVSQIAMFFTLGLLVVVGQLADVAWKATLVALALVFVARPIATWVATVTNGFTGQERVALGWAGLRGAVPIVLATFPAIAGIENGEQYFSIAFFAVLISTLIQGGTFEMVARWLKVTSHEPALPRPLSDAGTIRRLGAEVVEYIVSEGDAIVGRRVRDLGLPRQALVNVVVRGSEAIPPRGSTVIEVHDRLHMLVREEVASKMQGLMRKWHRGFPKGEVEQQPVRPIRGHPAISTIRKWQLSDGDPAYPKQVLGITVIDRVQQRVDRPGALLVLEDGRYAVTGPLLVVGNRVTLLRQVRDQIRRAQSGAEREWWLEVIATLEMS